MRLSEGLNTISTNVKALAMPFALMVILVALFIFLLKVGIGQVLTLRERVEASKQEENILSQKLNVLNTSEDSALPLADLSLIALPAENPTLIIISQLKTFASERGVTISNIEARGANQTEGAALSTSEIELTVSGQVVSIFEFLKALKTITPLVILDEIKLSGEAKLAHTEVKIVGQFAALPTTLPALATPLNELTAEEKDILAKISTYSVPAFTEVLPSGPYERVDVFNF